jgi:high affinity Mn2+ porin
MAARALSRRAGRSRLVAAVLGALIFSARPHGVQGTAFADEQPEPAKETEAKTEKPAGEPAAAAEAEKEEWFSIHGQATVVPQGNWKFRSPYVGPATTPYVGANSFLPLLSYRTTNTDTLYFDVRLWRGTEVIFNPEVSGGRGLSDTTGIAGFPNGEAVRVGAPFPTPYVARLFVRQTIGLDGDVQKVEAAANQLAGVRDIDRITFTIGKLSATDIFDDNRYSHDPRTQFLNWSLMYNGAWDYPANTRGYDYGAAAEINTRYLAVRYGIFGEPTEANGSMIDTHFPKASGQILEFEERYEIGGHPGKLREWGFLNHAHMGNYREALAEMPVSPDITLTRAYRFKYGFGVNVEQELTPNLGLWMRAGWNDGQSESWAFTEIDATAAIGLNVSGTLWSRPKDAAGLAFVVNGISDAHRDYLAAGGLGFIIGDGRLNYRPEQIVETYYNWVPKEWLIVSADFQAVENPAYNHDRGPVAIFAIRAHLAF